MGKEDIEYQLQTEDQLQWWGLEFISLINFLSRGEAHQTDRRSSFECKWRNVSAQCGGWAVSVKETKHSGLLQETTCQKECSELTASRYSTFRTCYCIQTQALLFQGAPSPSLSILGCEGLTGQIRASSIGNLWLNFPMGLTRTFSSRLTVGGLIYQPPLTDVRSELWSEAFLVYSCLLSP